MSAKKLKIDSNVHHFSCDSFDRFGDDLTEEILQYLKFSDKVRLECVSKQWKRLIYNKQFVVQLTKYQDIFKKIIVEDMVEMGLVKEILVPWIKKCSNIRTAILWFYTKRIDLSVLAQYCPQLKALQMNVKYLEDIELFKFGYTYGYRLVEIEFYDDCPPNLHGNMVMFLGLCSNLKTICFTPEYPLNEYDFIKNENNFLPKLEAIKSLVIRNNNIDQMKVLAHKYHKTMKSLNIMFVMLTTEQMKTCLKPGMAKVSDSRGGGLAIRIWV